MLAFSVKVEKVAFAEDRRCLQDLGLLLDPFGYAHPHFVGAHKLV